MFPYLSDEVALPRVPPSTHFHVGGLTTMLRECPASTLALLASARNQGLPISLGLAPGDCPRESIDEAVRPTDLILGSVDEFAFFLGTHRAEPYELAQALMMCGFDSFVITLGYEGALARTPEGSLLHAPAASQPVVSTVGAGDTLVAVLVAGRVLGHPFDTSLRLACFAASLSVVDDTWDDWMATVSDLQGLLHRYSTDHRPSRGY